MRAAIVGVTAALSLLALYRHGTRQPCTSETSQVNQHGVLDWALIASAATCLVGCRSRCRPQLHGTASRPWWTGSPGFLRRCSIRTVGGNGRAGPDMGRGMEAQGGMSWLPSSAAPRPVVWVYAARMPGTPGATGRRASQPASQQRERGDVTRGTCHTSSASPYMCACIHVRCMHVR